MLINQIPGPEAIPLGYHPPMILSRRRLGLTVGLLSIALVGLVVVQGLLLLGAWLGMVVLQPDPPAGQPLAEQPSEAQPETFDQGPLLVAQLIAAEDAVWSAGAMPTVDQPVAAGEYRLAEGTARLLFNDGAQVLIESPAFFTLDSAKQMVLHEGRLVGYCNEQARGFVVRTPHAEFTDLGTEFGVVVDPWNQSELHVFKGLVQAQPLTQGDQPVEPIVVSANEAVAASAVEPIRLLDQGADNQRFTATRPIPVSSFNTGQSLRADGSDAHWSITAVDGNVLQQPLPAVLFEPPATPDDRPDLAFLANQPDRLGWVTLDPQYAGLQEGKGKSLTFSTTFDLGRLDPATARLELGFLADNFIAEVRLNGKPIDVPEHAHRPPFVELNRLIIEHGFVAGVNTLEIVVHNDPPTHLTELGLDYLALVGELSVTARLPWQKQ